LSLTSPPHTLRSTEREEGGGGVPDNAVDTAQPEEYDDGQGVEEQQQADGTGQETHSMSVEETEPAQVMPEIREPSDEAYKVIKTILEQNNVVLEMNHRIAARLLAPYAIVLTGADGQEII